MAACFLCPERGWRLSRRVLPEVAPRASVEEQDLSMTQLGRLAGRPHSWDKVRKPQGRRRPDRYLCPAAW